MHSLHRLDLAQTVIVRPIVVIVPGIDRPTLRSGWQGVSTGVVGEPGKRGVLGRVEVQFKVLGSGVEERVVYQRQGWYVSRFGTGNTIRAQEGLTMRMLSDVG